MVPVETIAPRVWVIYEETAEGEMNLIEAHVSGESAEVAMKGFHVASGTKLYVAVLELKSEVDVETSKEDKPRYEPL